MVRSSRLGRVLDLRSRPRFDLSRSNHTSFDSSRRGEHDGAIAFALTLETKELWAKQHFRKFWHFGPWGSQFFTRSKKLPRLFRNYFRRAFDCFFFRFSLRCLRAELAGGVETPPPPPALRRWRRAPARRGLSRICVRQRFKACSLSSSVFWPVICISTVVTKWKSWFALTSWPFWGQTRPFEVNDLWWRHGRFSNFGAVRGNLVR